MKNNKWVQFIFKNWHIKILSFVAAFLLYWFNLLNSREERQIVIPLNLRINEQLIPSSPVPNSVKIIIKGDRNEIYLISENSIECIADLSDRSSQGNYSVPLKVVRRGTAAQSKLPLEVTVEPDRISVALEEKVSRYVSVNPSLSGFVRTGYEVVSSFVTPDKVLVEGPKSNMEKLDSVTTEFIDLSDQFNDLAKRVQVVSLDPYLRFPSNSTVEFFADVEEKVIANIYEGVAILTLGLDPSFGFILSKDSGMIRLSGKQNQLEKFNKDQISLVLYADGIKAPGEYTIKVVPEEIPSQLILLDYQPKEIKIQVYKQ